MYSILPSLSMPIALMTAFALVVSLGVPIYFKLAPDLSQPILAIWFNAEPILLMLRQEPEVARLASVYLKCASWGLPAYTFNCISRSAFLVAFYFPPSLNPVTGVIFNPRDYLLYQQESLLSSHLLMPSSIGFLVCNRPVFRRVFITEIGL